MTAEVIKINAPIEIKVRRHENGKVKSKTSYMSGKNHGMETEWYENGQKMWETMWKNGKQHGSYADWQENGQKSWQASRMDGGRHGVRTWWNENGKKGQEIYHLHKKEYARIEWDEEGDVIEANFTKYLNKHSTMKKLHRHARKLVSP